MADTNNCMYCNKDENLKNLMIFICELPYSNVYLFKNQACLGRCVVAYKNHADELYELTESELKGFMSDTQKVCLAINVTVKPEKINLGLYGDTCKHVHWHVVPKQIGGVDFGTTFQMQANPPVFLSDKEYEALIEKIKSNIK